MAPVAPPVEGRRWFAHPPPTPVNLEGRVGIIVFWSFGCEASLRAIDQAQDLLAHWPDQATVLAVHTPRFPFEDDERRLVQAITRHRIHVPVVHDPEYLTWNRYNPAGWPATAIADRDGRVIGMAHGVAEADVVADVVAAELARPTGRRDRDRVERTSSSGRRRSPLAHSRPARVDTTAIERILGQRAHTSLWFPTSVAVSPAGLVAVADSGNDRLLVGRLDDDRRTYRPDVEITDVARPTAVACAGDELLYAIEGDGGAVIQIDLAAGTVDLVADEELEAPTALLVDQDGSLVVADAGRDQLIRIVGTAGEVLIGPIAGRGTTGCRDGAAERAELAQPVAMARVGRGIAFCDAASSNLRVLTDGGDVLTTTGNEFYDWGLVDGPPDQARLQRPGGLATGPGGELFVADTGNDRIRVLTDRRLRTLGLAGLDQPSGLAVLPDGHLLIADTGNHRLVVADPTGSRAWPLAVYPAAMTSVWEDHPAAGGTGP